MDWKSIKGIAESRDKKWFYIQKEVAVLLKRSRQEAAAFQKAQSVPFYCNGRVKKYFPPHIMEAVESTRLKTRRTRI